MGGKCFGVLFRNRLEGKGGCSTRRMISCWFLSNSSSRCVNKNGKKIARGSIESAAHQPRDQKSLPSALLAAAWRALPLHLACALGISSAPPLPFSPPQRLPHSSKSLSAIRRVLPVSRRPPAGVQQPCHDRVDTERGKQRRHVVVKKYLWWIMLRTRERRRVQAQYDMM